MVTSLDKSTVVEMLHQASELEHSLACQYLYAGFTLKSGGDPDLTASQAARTGQWGQQISKIAVQEMSHLVMASNILTAIGETPHFSRPNYPVSAIRYSDVGLPSMLTPLDLETVSRFTCWEKPEDSGWWDDWCTKRAADAKKRLGPAALAEAEPPYSTIGELYHSIEQGLQDSWFDPATVSRQVTSRLVPFTPTIVPVAGYADAKYCIDLIVEEGEGTPNWDSMSHFAYFHQIVNELKGATPGQETGDEAFVPAWTTVDDPAYVAAWAPPHANLIEDPAAAAVGLLFNDVYLVMINILTRLFVPEGESENERAALANVALAVMPLVVKQLGIALTRMPAGAAYPAHFAGPSFELPPSLSLPSGDREAAWDDFREQMTEVASRCRLLTLDPPEGLTADTVDRLGVVRKNLELMVPLLDIEAVPTR
jgi:Ferritin-like